MRVPRVALFVICSCLLLCLASCQPVQENVPAEKPRAAATVGAGPVLDQSGEWTNSDNGDLSLRLRAKPAEFAINDNMVVIADIRNNRATPVTILRPFGDAPAVEESQLKIWGEQGEIEYSDLKYTYILTAEAFVTISPNESVTDTLELTVDNHAGSSKAGIYTLRFDYSYNGEWDERAARGGFTGIWQGAISSSKIQLLKRDAGK